MNDGIEIMGLKKKKGKIDSLVQSEDLRRLVHRHRIFETSTIEPEIHTGCEGGSRPWIQELSCRASHEPQLEKKEWKAKRKHPTKERKKEMNE